MSAESQAKTTKREKTGPKSNAKRVDEPDEKGASPRLREAGGIALLGLGLFVGLSLLSFQLQHASLMGPGGAAVASGLYALVGVGAYLVVWIIGRLAFAQLAGRRIRWLSAATGAVIGVILSVAVLLHLALGTHRVSSHSPGGLVGELGAELLAAGVGRLGAALVATVTLAISLLLSTSLSLWQVAALAWKGVKEGVFALGRGITMLFPERKKASATAEAPLPEDTIADSVNDVDDVDIASSRVSKKKAAAAAAAPAVREPTPLRLVAKNGELVDPAAVIAATAPRDDEATSHDESPPALAPVIVEPRKMAPPAPAAVEKKRGGVVDFIPTQGDYKLPELVILDDPEVQVSDINKQEMLELAERLQKSLADFGVKGNVVQIHPGPVVTMYEFVPAAGTKLSKITTLSNDLAMSLHALRVRIVAPIPGKGSVGIEVPNKERATVFLKEIFVDESTQKQKSKLTLALGKDIAGAAVSVDLAKMPHLLVAGTTGSGKSVSVNGMICSILFNATPDEVRLIMIDPKMVELSIYEGIPHLLLPVVTDPQKANLALKWAVDEMERRYELVSKAGVRDILSFNKVVEKQLAAPPVRLEPKKIKVYIDGQPVECDPTEQAVVRAGGVVTEEVRDDISAAHAELQKRAQAIAAEPLPKKLPYIVVLIDEFADLMMVAPKDVETSVARIAQKARAVGIHLILATQRPSVDVITGLIKANFPSRIAFQVASKIDSRTILDQQGAENLLGMGDMLFTDRGQALRRVHGALVTDGEIKKLVDFLKTQGSPVYDLDILRPREEEGGEEGAGGEEGGGPNDPLYDQAVRIVCETRSASVSMLQRRLQIGFNRSARLIEKMEKDGIVGAPNGSKPREVLANAI